MAGSESADVLVLGGGFAGLSAATALAEAGVRVTVLEKRPHLGGRAYSFKDPRTGETVDNGQHLFMGCYRETRVFLRRIGTEALLRLAPARVDYAEPGGRRDRLSCPGFFPAPLHVAWGIARLKGVSWSDKLALRRLNSWFGALNGSFPRELDRFTVRQWLDSLGQPRALQQRLFDPIAIGALNELPERASALGMAQVLKEVFFKDAQSSWLGLSSVGLSELYCGAAQRFIEERDGRIVTGASVVSVARDGGGWTVHPERGGALQAASVISAMPPWALAKVERPRSLRGDWETFEAAPILGINLWLSEPLLQSPMTGLLGTELHWAFNKDSLWDRKGEGQYLSLVISGAHAHAAKSPAELLELSCRDLRACFPVFRKAGVRAWTVVKEPFATPSPVPGSDARRPGHASPEPGFFYAGDWTQTGLPATIESAVKSGHAAARLALSAA